MDSKNVDKVKMAKNNSVDLVHKKKIDEKCAYKFNSTRDKLEFFVLIICFCGHDLKKQDVVDNI